MSPQADALEVHDVRATADGLAVTVVTPRGATGLEIRAGDPIDAAVGDAVVCLTLLPALALGSRTLQVPAPVSERLLARTSDLGEIFRRWMAIHGPAPIVTAPEVTRAERQSDAASFFSLGVDSFYTALTRADDVDAFLFLRGFDLPDATSDLLEDVAERARSVAGELGVELATFDLTVRPFSDPLVSWEMYHGGCLAAVAHAAGRWGDVLVPATLDYRFQAPWGSHPWTDPLWSSEKVAIEDDGVWASRLDKIRHLAEHDVAMQHLRVCWSTTTELNCGHCPKCLDTILALEIVGAAGRCATLPAAVDVHAWEQVPPPSGGFLQRAVRSTRVVGHLRDLLDAAGADHPVAPQLRRMLAPYDQIDRDADPLARFAPDRRDG